MAVEKIITISPRSFCAGVDRAIEIVEKAVLKYGTPIYVRKEIVHNKHVVNRLREKGVVFVQDVSDTPPHATLIFSAHGVSPAVWEEARQKKIRIIDATCPLVTKVHNEVLSFVTEGYSIILIGHRNHEETEGTRGEAPEHITVVETAEEVDELAYSAQEKLAYLSQTTLSMDDTAGIITALRAKYPQITGPRKDDICYATQNRQNAVKEQAPNCDVVFVVGYPNSSNSVRLVEVARAYGAKSYLISDAKSITPDMFENARIVGITAGASSPNFLVDEVVEKIRDGREIIVKHYVYKEENVKFSLPKELIS